MCPTLPILLGTDSDFSSHLWLPVTTLAIYGCFSCVLLSSSAQQPNSIRKLLSCLGPIKCQVFPAPQFLRWNLIAM